MEQSWQQGKERGDSSNKNENECGQHERRKRKDEGGEEDRNEGDAIPAECGIAVVKTWPIQADVADEESANLFSVLYEVPVPGNSQSES